jgi:hypothetical protein
VTSPRLLALLAAIVLVLAGCGGGSGGSDDNGVAAKSADEILADTTAAVKEATSVYVHGGGTSEGSPLELDLHLVANEGGAGHVSVGDLSFDIVRIGDTTYFKGDDDFLTQVGGEAAVQLFHDRWIQAPADSGDLASFTPLTDIEQLFEGVFSGHEDVEKGDETDVNGQPAIEVKDTSSDGTLYVSTEGQPYPLKLASGADDDSSGEIFFEDWDESFELETPEDPVDISQLNR